MSQPMRDRAATFLLICPKNTKLVEDVEILLPVKFHWILFSGFRGEVEMSQVMLPVIAWPEGGYRNGEPAQEQEDWIELRISGSEVTWL